MARLLGITRDRNYIAAIKPKDTPILLLQKEGVHHELGALGVSTRGGVNQPLASPGVRAHRDPDALGGHRGVLRYVIDAAVAGFDAYVHLEHFLGGGKEGSQRRTIFPMRVRHDRCD